MAVLRRCIASVKCVSPLKSKCMFSPHNLRGAHRSGCNLYKWKICISALTHNKHPRVWKILKIQRSVVAPGSEHTQYSEPVFGSPLVDLPVSVISGSDFEGAQSVIKPAKWLPEVSKAADCRGQSQETNGVSLFIREFRLMESCHLPFYHPPWQKSMRYEYLCDVRRLLFSSVRSTFRGMLKSRRTGWKERGTRTGTLRQRVHSLRPSARPTSKPPRPNEMRWDW